MRILVASLFLCASVTAASAQGSNCEVKVNSDKFIADLNGKSGQFAGNVIVTQCDTRIRADQVRVTTANGQANQVAATGNVVVDSPKSGTATGSTAVYDVPRRMVTMTGNVILKRGRDVMRGAQLTVNLATGQAQVGGGVSATTPGATQPQNTRVQAIFTPPTGGGQ